jgi:hypothetical protein
MDALLIAYNLSDRGGFYIGGEWILIIGSIVIMCNMAYHHIKRKILIIKKEVKLHDQMQSKRMQIQHKRRLLQLQRKY